MLSVLSYSDKILSKMPSDEEQEINCIYHFYFCFLIASGIAFKGKDGKTSKTRFRFMMNWLDNAKGTHLFPSYVEDEIKWLMQELKIGKDAKHVHRIASNAYHVYDRILNAETNTDE
ncbi:TPA: hypothetical protein ACIJNZ_004347 [Klebsiella pneumoniae]